MNKVLERKGLEAYALCTAAVSGIIALLVYLVYNIAIGKFTIDVFLLIVAGIVFTVISLLTDFKFAPILTVIGYSLAVGFYLNDRIIMF